MSAEEEKQNKGGKIDAGVIAEVFKAEIKRTIEKFPGDGFKPLLVGFLATNDPGSKWYAKWTNRACESLGIAYELREVELYDIEEAIRKANDDPVIHGIIVYYPCFGSVPSFYGGSMDDRLRDVVCIEKDVEGLCATYRNYLYHNTRFFPHLISGKPSGLKTVLPCTPLAIVKILEHLKLGADEPRSPGFMKGEVVTIVNRSEIVGHPLAAMLANDGADVYSVDIDSIFLMQKGKMYPTDKTPEEAVRISDVVVLGVPSEKYMLPVEWVKPGATVVSVSHFKNVDVDELLKVEGVQYCPSVGKVTIAMLQRNLLRLVENFHTPDTKYKVIKSGGCLIEKDSKCFDLLKNQ